MKKIVLIALVMASALVLASCSSEAKDPIVGKWTNGLSTFEFKADGTIISEVFGDSRGGTWVIKGDELTIHLEASEMMVEGTHVYKFKVEKDKLYLDSHVYVKA